MTYQNSVSVQSRVGRRGLLIASVENTRPALTVKDVLMRIHHWLTAIMSLLTPLVVPPTTYAQSGQAWPTPQTYPAGAGGGSISPAAAQTDMAGVPMVPSMFQPAFTNNDPLALYPPGATPDYLPYPAISPHLGPNLEQERTFNRRGLWLRDQVQRKREWFGSVEYLWTKFDAPDGARVGSRPALVRPDNQFFPGFPPGTLGDHGHGRGDSLGTSPGSAGGGGGGGGGGAGAISDVTIPVGPGALPWVFLQQDVTDFIGEAVIPDANNFFPQRNLSVFDQLPSNGFRLRTGFFNGDGTGWSIEGWWSSKSNDRFQVGKDNIHGIPITQDMIAGVPLDLLPPDALPDVFDDGTNAGWFIPFAKIGGLPLIDNSGIYDQISGTFSTVGRGFTGSTQKYDLMYRLDYSAQAWGGNVTYYLGNILKRDSMQVKSFVSGRYLNITEGFAFTGLDSGFHYAVEIDDGTFRPDGEVVGPLYPLFRSYLESNVTSQLAGPELGLRGDIGHNGTVNLWWQAAFGLMANTERLRVKGNNIGNAHLFNTNFGDPATIGDESGFGTIFGPAFDMFANDNSFNDVETHTHVSPVLSLGINAELDIFDALPVTRKLSLFDAAKLSIGYNLLFVGQLARPGESVRWRGFPEFPSVLVRRDTWDTQQFNIGLVFEK
jgi:hypothetical protein